ncbi:MAG: hypothetical protein HRT37_20220 [Alteromonadaceae bacterium]|nr:hypothetical protein [Alteromonadaceae bacterium]
MDYKELGLPEETVPLYDESIDEHEALSNGLFKSAKGDFSIAIVLLIDIILHDMDKKADCI